METLKNRKEINLIMKQNENKSKISKGITLALASGTLVTLGANTVYANEGVTPPVDTIVVDSSLPVSQDIPTTEGATPNNKESETEQVEVVSNTEETTAPITEGQPVDPTQSTSETTEVEKPTEEDKEAGKKTDKPSEEPKKEEEKKDEPKKEGEFAPAPTLSPNTVLTPEATVKPTTNQPITTSEGYVVVGNEKGIVTVANADGTTTKGRAEDFGGVTNGDGTVSFKSKDNKKETLPVTGATESIFMSLLGMLLSVFGIMIYRKNKFDNTNNYNYM